MREVKGYELLALLYAEKYGIIEYSVEGNEMVYEEFYKNEGRFTHRVLLDKEEFVGGLL
jgi:hypothetical protein